MGSYLGGRLAQAGNEVAFLARGKHLEALRARALRVESIKGGFEVRVRATNAAEEIGRVDAILVAVKAWQVTEAAESIRAMIDAESVVVPLQNAVEAPAQLTSVLGPERVTGGLCKIVAYMAGPGHVRHSGAEPFVAFGEFDPAARMQGRLKGDAPVVASHSEARFSREGAEPVGQLSERLKELRHAFVRAGVTCEITPEITGRCGRSSSSSRRSAGWARLRDCALATSARARSRGLSWYRLFARWWQSRVLTKPRCPARS